LKKHTKTLALSRETIRLLSEADLRHAAGGTNLVTVDDPITARTEQATCINCLRR
jgi:hypothetical protein